MKKQDERHILWLTPGFPVDESDTRCIPPLQSLAIGLRDCSGVRLTIISLHYPFEKKRYLWNDIPVHACGASNRPLVLRLPIWKKVIDIAKAINKEHPIDQIHSFWLSECAWLGQKLHHRFSKPHLVTLMGQEGLKGNVYEPWIHLEKLKIAAISPYQFALFEKRKKRKPDHIIPWGIDRENLPLLGNAEREIDILGVGSLIALKDFKTFIRIVANMKKEKPDLKCALVGDGVEKKELEKMANDLGLADCLKFHGLVSREMVFRLMAKSRCLLHPSQYESFGMVFLEALASGMHIVSREIGIARKMDQWTIGDNLEELEAGVKKILGKTNQSSVILFDQESTVKTYVDLYRIM
ncbi:MAG: glycosyltransferase [Bacteroidota bacterium]